MQNRKTKTLVLIYSLLLLVVYLATDSDTVVRMGLTSGSWLGRLTYQHFHGSLLHLACNVWAMLSFTFIAHASWRKWLAAFIVSATYPFTTDEPIIGLSGVIYCVAGMYALNPRTLRGIARYNLLMMASLALGLLFPHVGVGIHVYCYAVGIVISFLNKPIIKKS